MVLAYLFHGNDFEFDAAGLTKPAMNNPGIFSILQSTGYRTEFLCATALGGKKMLPMLAGTIGPVWSTNDFSELLRRFEVLTTTPPFAAYVWNLVTHAEHAGSLSSYAIGLGDLLGGACAVADHALGCLLDILERRDLMDETTIVIFGDHGDDYWTHGFKSGLLHGTEAYTHLIHAPLLIRDSSLPPGHDNRLISTVDLAPTILELLCLSSSYSFPCSGRSALGAEEREYLFSQNFTANQPDAPHWDVRKSFSVSDKFHTLMVTSRGLELFNHRMDPGNHCNLLHFFDLDQQGRLVLRPADGHVHLHFATTMRHMLGQPAMADDFQKLRDALRNHVRNKNVYVAEREPGHEHVLELSCFDIINRRGYESFFDNGGAGASEAAASTEIKYTAQVLLRLLKKSASRKLRNIFRRR